MLFQAPDMALDMMSDFVEPNQGGPTVFNTGNGSVLHAV